jgi:hypothetical protein
VCGFCCGRAWATVQPLFFPALTGNGMKTTIKLDLDERLTADGIELLEKRVAFVSDIAQVPLELCYIWRSHHGGAHVILTAFREDSHLHPVEVVLLQALLGSDWKRETFNYQRARVLRDAPMFWQLSDRWNVHYMEKLEEESASF